MKKIKILIVSYFPLDVNLSTGNTIINIFSGMDDRLEFANIYFKDGKINNNLCNKYYHISEKECIKSIVSRKKVGEEIYVKKNNLYTHSNTIVYDKARQLRWNSFLLIQDLIGILSNWKAKSLDTFINEYNPDIIFGPLGRVPIPNIIMTYLKNTYKIPMVTYAWDDHYSIENFSISPFFWMKKILERHYIKKGIENSTKLYVITDKMKEEYTKRFNRECSVLYKVYDFTEERKIKEINNPIKIAYLGNIGAGRWQTIAKVARAINVINKKEKKIQLDIYTATPITKKMKKKLEYEDSSNINNAVPNEQIYSIMEATDILLHVSPLSKKNASQERLSFSTKVVDYMYAGKCILCVGKMNATFEYLKKNKAAVIINNKIVENLESLIEDNQIILKYGENAWLCGKQNHCKKVVQEQLIMDFKNILDEGVKFQK